MRKTKKKNRGFTLVELVVAILIASMIFTLIVQLQGTGLRSFGMQTKEYKLQNNVKNATEEMTKVLKKSTSVWPVDKSKFNPQTFNPDSPPALKEGKSRWNYVAISSDRKSINNYVWNEKTNKYDVIPLTMPGKEQNKEIYYTVDYFKNLTEPINDLTNKGIFSFKIGGAYQSAPDDNQPVSFDLSSQVLLDNLIDKMIPTVGVDTDQITGFAYMEPGRGDAVKTATKKAIVVFVADYSNSMNEAIGSDNWSSDKKYTYKGKSKYLIKDGGRSYFALPKSQWDTSYDDLVFESVDLYSYRDQYRILITDHAKIKYGGREWVWSGFLSGDWYYYWYYIEDDEGNRCRVYDSAGNNRWESEKLNPNTKYYYDGKVKVKRVEDRAYLSESIMKPRIDVLRAKQKEFVRKLAEDKLTAFSYIRFSNAQRHDRFGNDLIGTKVIYQTPHDKMFFDDLSNALESMNAVEVAGGTNVGYGLKMAYEHLADSKYDDYEKFLVLLTDGQPTLYGETDKGSGNSFSTATLNYIGQVYNDVGKKAKVRKTMLIGFSGLEKDNQQLEEIKKKLGGGEDVSVRKAKNAEKLGLAFEEFVEAVQESMWYFWGP